MKLHLAPPGTNGAAADAAVLDEAHIGHINGALGTIHHDDTAPRRGLSLKTKTLLAIVGPGLIVMAGDNDAGAFSTYAQSGQNYGTHLMWILLLLVPVLYVNQEMVLRLGAVSGVGHARLIFERFGKFWGAFSVIDLLVLNALTIVTEFIGISLAVNYLGLPKVPTVILAAVVVIGAVSTGSFRRFERLCLTLVAFSLLVIPLFLLVHPPVGEVARSFAVPSLPHGQLPTVMLLIIAIVGTTVAPWQLFFQQSYVIDKRITPRWINYERVDLVIGIAIVVVGGVALMAVGAATFAGHPGFGGFTDAGGTAAGLAHNVSRTAGDLFAIALIDASIIGAAAIGLSTAYATSDMFGLKHSLHRPVSQAKGFYVCYAGLMAVAAALVLTPHAPLGLLTEGVQVLAGVLLPERERLLAPALQRQGRPGSVGQRAQAQHVDRQHRLGARAPLGHPHGECPVPGHLERPDHRRARRWHAARRVRRRVPPVSGAPSTGRGHGDRRAGRGPQPRDVADGPPAAAGASVDVDAAQAGALHAAGLPGGCLRPGDRQDHRGRREVMTGRGRWASWLSC